MCEEKTEPQRAIYKSTIPPGDLNTELSVLVVIAEKKIFTAIIGLNYTINQLNLIDIYALLL